MNPKEGNINLMLRTVSSHESRNTLPILKNPTGQHLFRIAFYLAFSGFRVTSKSNGLRCWLQFGNYFFWQMDATQKRVLVGILAEPSFEWCSCHTHECTLTAAKRYLWRRDGDCQPNQQPSQKQYDNLTTWGYESQLACGDEIESQLHSSINQLQSIFHQHDLILGKWMPQTKAGMVGTEEWHQPPILLQTDATMNHKCRHRSSNLKIVCEKSVLSGCSLMIIDVNNPTLCVMA